MKIWKKSLVLFGCGATAITGVAVGTALNSDVKYQHDFLINTADAKLPFQAQYPARSYTKIFQQGDKDSQTIHNEMSKAVYDSFIDYGVLKENVMVDEIKNFFLAYMQGYVNVDEGEVENYRHWDKTMTTLRKDLRGNPTHPLEDSKCVNGFNTGSLDVKNLKVDFKKMKISFSVTGTLEYLSPIEAQNENNIVIKDVFDLEIIDADLKIDVDSRRNGESLVQSLVYLPIWKIIPSKENIENQRPRHTMTYIDSNGVTKEATVFFDDVGNSDFPVLPLDENMTATSILTINPSHLFSGVLLLLV